MKYDRTKKFICVCFLVHSCDKVGSLGRLFFQCFVLQFMFKPSQNKGFCVTCNHKGLIIHNPAVGGGRVQEEEEEEEEEISLPRVHLQFVTNYLSV